MRFLSHKFSISWLEANTQHIVRYLREWRVCFSKSYLFSLLNKSWKMHHKFPLFLLSFKVGLQQFFLRFFSRCNRFPPSILLSLVSWKKMKIKMKFGKIQMQLVFLSLSLACLEEKDDVVSLNLSLPDVKGPNARQKSSGLTWFLFVSFKRKTQSYKCHELQQVSHHLHAKRIHLILAPKFYTFVQLSH